MVGPAGARAGSGAAEHPVVDGGAPGRPRAPHHHRERQAARGGSERGPVRPRVLRMVCRAGPARHRRVGAVAARRQAHLGAAPARRAGRRGHALEFPGHDGHPQDRAGPGCRVQRRPEAVSGHAADGARHRENRRRCRAPARHLQRGHRQPGPDAPGRAPQSPAHPEDRLHRLHGDRPRDHGRRRLSDQAARFRAGRQRTVHRLRRRRPRGRRRGRRRHQVPPGRRPVVHRRASCPPSSMPCGRYGSGRASSAACGSARSSVPRRGPASMRWWRMPCGAAPGWRPVATR